MNWATVTGPITAIAVALIGAIAVLITIARERRGPEPTQWTLVTSRPIVTTTFAVIIVAGTALVVLRLGVLS